MFKRGFKKPVIKHSAPHTLFTDLKGASFFYITLITLLITTGVGIPTGSAVILTTSGALCWLASVMNIRIFGRRDFTLSSK